MDKKPILCLDFDGVIHSYKSGWKGVHVIPDPPTDGWWEWAIAAAQHFDLQVYSSRSKDLAGLDAMRQWFTYHWFEYRGRTRCSTASSPDEDWLEFHSGDTAAPHASTCRLRIVISAVKPPAFLTIDDRAVCFEGTWPDPIELLQFKTWQEKRAMEDEPQQVAAHFMDIAAFLRETSTTLDRWANESRQGGWSTHQVNANRERARKCLEVAQRCEYLASETVVT